MKKYKTQKTTIALSFALAIIISGCQKIMDYIHLPGNGDAVLNICQIKTITTDDEYGADYVFNYNKRGDLESIITNELQPGNANRFFIYDNKHRVSQLLFSHGATVDAEAPMDAWRVFEYNNLNQIIKVNTYRFGYNGPNGGIPSSFWTTEIATLQYDANNRVIASRDSIWDNGVFWANYNYAFKYDERGNLIFSVQQFRSQNTNYNDTSRFNPSDYDNKISIRRTNKIWMFLEKNYSVNNRFKAETYNSYGLPLTFDSWQTDLNNFIGNMKGNAIVEYRCK